MTKKYLDEINELIIIILEKLKENQLEEIEEMLDRYMNLVHKCSYKYNENNKSDIFNFLQNLLVKNQLAMSEILIQINQIKDTLSNIEKMSSYLSGNKMF